MTYDPTLIAPFKSGLSQYYKPFLIGNDAFVELDNCYSWRGSILKREGSSILARLAQWSTATTITNATPPQVTAAGHGLLTGDMVWLENVVATNGTITSVVTGNTTVVNLGAHGFTTGQTAILTSTSNVTLQSGGSINNGTYYITATTATSITLNVGTTGTGVTAGTVLVGGLEKQAFQITKINANNFTLQILNSTSSPLDDVPAAGSAQSADIYLPIVGTRTFLLTSTGNEQLVAFHPKRAFLYNTSTNNFDNISFNTASAPIKWSGTKDNFFYTSNFATVMWTTNNVFNTTDQPVGIRFFNGSTSAGWSNFQPQVNGTPTYLNSALLVLPYKGRLICLNTNEGNNTAPPAQTDTNFYNRARWSQLGTPFVTNAPTGFSNDVNAWRDDIPGKGGFNDADTSERIVGAQIIQDTLIVFFQFSTWRLRYTGNEVLPFIWERINTQYGSEATFASVPFDDGAVTISRRGIVKATFNDVDRIDLDVPDYVDKFETGLNEIGLNRIQGIRDYQKRLVYWLYGDEAGNNQTPNKILCFNYQDNTWSTFSQSFTTLGIYKKTLDNIWSTWTTPWVGDTSTWNTPLDQQNTIVVVAGAVDSNIWQIMDNDLSTDNGVSYNFTITTNLINPYFKQGRRCKLAYYDLYVTNTSFGQVTVENFTDDNPSDPWLIKTVNTNDNAISANPVKVAKYIRVFLGMIARNHQITITLTDTQLADANIGPSDFELQGIIFHTRMEGRIKQ